VTVSHTLLTGGAGARALLRVRIENSTSLLLPSGLRVSLSLGGALIFDRAAVVASALASSGVRLGSEVPNSGGDGGGGESNGGGGGGAGGAAAVAAAEAAAAAL
jgi:hypothetical protein